MIATFHTLTVILMATGFAGLASKYMIDMKFNCETANHTEYSSPDL